MSCTLYQPMLAVLESSKMTFTELSRSTAPNMYKEYALMQAARVISIPDPMNASPLEHILYFFANIFPARVASLEKSVESAARKSSEHLAGSDPSAYSRLPG